MAVLRAANSRAFCAQIGQTLEGAAYVEDMDRLREVIGQPSPTGDWVLKRAFGFAGGQRRRAVGGVLDPSTRGFAERSFRAGEGLQVEPWLRRGRDFALHGYLQPGGTLLIGPLLGQRCDAMGRWQGSEHCAPDALAPAQLGKLRHELERSAAALHALGYFGPFGIDAYEYHDRHGLAAFQPRSEINARLSMGYPRELLEQALGGGAADE
jgi:hypothetical protein